MTKDNAAAESETRQPPLSAREEWSEFAKTAVVAIVLALLVRTFLFEPFNIPSGSMKPTLEIGDYLFVYKPAYGFSRYSFPFGISPIAEGRVRARAPQRGDIIVFKKPTDTRTDYIKRLVGMPGDRIQMIEGRLHINGKALQRDYVIIKRVEENGETVTTTEYTETLPNGVTYSIYEESDSDPLDNTQEFIVPPDHYFMMGDNRDNSQDSRYIDSSGHAPVGFVPFENLVGRATFIFFSTNGYANIAEIWKWPRSIRYNRLFRLIEPHSPAVTPSLKPSSALKASNE